MKAFQAAFVVAMFAFASLLAPAAWAQGHADHIVVVPKDLKWADVPSLPAGAKIAVIEGPLNEAKPLTFRLKFPANYKIPAHWHPAIEHVMVRLLSSALITRLHSGNFNPWPSRGTLSRNPDWAVCTL